MRFIIVAMSLLLLTSLQSEVLAAAPSPQNTPNTFASTPQDEVVKVFGVRVLRTNVVGRFAVVLVAANAQRDIAPNQAFLLERFSFGWQLLDEVYSCMNWRDVSNDDQRQLMLQVPRPANQKCGPPESVDAGTRGDIESVRQLMYGPFVPSVQVSRNYAYGIWSSLESEGCELFRRVGNEWSVLESCHGGPLQGVCSLGIPQNTLRALALGECQDEVRPAPAQEATATGSAVAVVSRYYELWNAKSYGAMYEMFSPAYRAQHPYSAWLAQHQGTSSISVDAKPGASSADVQVVIHSVDRDVAGHQSHSTYAGAWHLTRGHSGWLLDSVSLHSI
jgi:hypothetical protein